MNNYEVAIKKLDHGYQVKVGCKTFAKENLKELLADIKDYFENPEKVYKKYKIKLEDVSVVASINNFPNVTWTEPGRILGVNI